jgi:NADH-quinone oxidoreductase subunit L
VSLLLLLLFPLAGFLIIGGLNKRLPEKVSGIIACVSVLLSFVLSVYVVYGLTAAGMTEYRLTLFRWMEAALLHISFELVADRLTAVMLLVVTGVGFLIHVYSMGYMQGDEDYPRFMAYMNLFVFFMLLLVLADNYVVMFVGWEGVGLCSYLLIGFWFKNEEYNRAANKAFIMNRIGDLGFMLGLFLIYQTFGTFQIREVMAMAESFPSGDVTLTAIALLLFTGAVGKSAQIPLYTWLPDAMAGPTPVSALIHAATMVTAGVYMVVRSHTLYHLSPLACDVVMVTGVATALLAALIGLKQNDIKKVLAYSTISQLGYMFAAAGAGAYNTAIFHLVTHAFFKALLFLAAGSVIHALHGTQDIRSMGGLKKYLPVTHLTFLSGTLAITGVPVFAGFFSKDEILAMTFSRSPQLFVLLVLGSVLTAVYMFRLYWLVFHGEFRGSRQQRNALHESPAVMRMPLIALALLSTVGGFIGVPEIFHLPHLLNNFLNPYSETVLPAVSHTLEYLLIVFSILMPAAVIMATRHYYVRQGNVPVAETEERGIERLVSRKFYVDELYSFLFSRPLDVLAHLTYRFLERNTLLRMVDGVQQGVNSLAAGLRYLQTGRTGSYLFIMVIGFLALMIYVFYL